MAIRVEEGRTVVITYRLTDAEGRLLEERTPENPYEYVQGSGQINAAIERAVEGKTAGYQAEIFLTPKEGYGEYNPALVVDVPRARLPAGVEVAVGMKFNTTNAKGEPLTVRVIEIAEKAVTVDGNHPLAGLELIFELRLLDVREAGVSADAGRIEIKVKKRSRDDVH